jgi:hypothetical protein
MQPSILPIQLRDEMCRDLVGCTVTFRRLAANSLMLYFEIVPRDVPATSLHQRRDDH